MSAPKTPGPALTEARNPRTLDLDRLQPRSLLARILEEDALVPIAVREALSELERASDRLLEVLERGGRWVNLGAGTSGRLGVLDAAEIPPTYGMDPERVQAVIAGGVGALLRAVEAAEDDTEAATRDLRERGFCAADALVALSASGETPYTVAAAHFARDLGAVTVGVTCSANSQLARAVEVAIAIEVGPEVVAGSTRMKGGLVQKVVLHLLSTTVMVQLGRVEGNMMTRLSPVSQKLHSRAIRIVMTLAGVESDEARKLLEAYDGDVEAALCAARGRR